MLKTLCLYNQHSYNTGSFNRGKAQPSIQASNLIMIENQNGIENFLWNGYLTGYGQITRGTIRPFIWLNSVDGSQTSLVKQKWFEISRFHQIHTNYKWDWWTGDQMWIRRLSKVIGSSCQFWEQKFCIIFRRDNRTFEADIKRSTCKSYNVNASKQFPILMWCKTDNKVFWIRYANITYACMHLGQTWQKYANIYSICLSIKYSCFSKPTQNFSFMTDMSWCKQVSLENRIDQYNPNLVNYAYTKPI